MPPKAKAMPVPQDREQAGKAIADYATIERSIEQLEILMNDEIAKIKQAYLQKAMPLRIQSETLWEAIQSYCEANRKELTRDGKTKTVDFGVGKTAWRKVNAKVVITGKEDDLVTFLRNSQNPEHAQLVRQTFEVSRVAMLNNPNLAKQLPGVEIEDEGETFEIKPDKASIPEASAEAAE